MPGQDRREIESPVTAYPSDNPLILAANAQLANPDFRQSLREMHAQSYPLVQMVEALGLDDEMNARLREIIEALSPDVVAHIRQATLEMLDRDGDSLPIDCDVTVPELDQGVAVDVSVVEASNDRVIHVRPVGE